ncbi:MAG: hypothetical protein U1F57_05900 [bacterium]
MLPLLLLGAASVALLAGCSRNEENKAPVKEDTTPPADVSYRRNCLVDSSCAAGERQAAIYDYVGAMYGEEGRVRFLETNGNQHLSPSEREYVERTFGRLTSPSQVDGFLTKSHSVFFQRSFFPTPKKCPEEPVVKLLHPQFGEGLVLYGAHGCGEAHGKQLSQSGMEWAIAANSQGWTFFVEGEAGAGWLDGEKKAIDMGPEVKLVKRMGEVLQIPVKEALVFNPTHPQVLEEAAKKSGYTREELIVGAVFQVFLSLYLQDPRANQGAVMTQAVDNAAPYFKIDRKKLADAMNDFLIKYGRDQVKESKKRMDVLVDFSNQLSLSPLRKELQTLSERKDALPAKALFLVGQAHLDLVKKAYEK